MMASLRRVKDKDGFLADREVFDRVATRAIVGDDGIIVGVDFNLSMVGAQISDTRDVGKVSIEGNFYLANLYLGLRFPLSEFMIRVLWITTLPLPNLSRMRVIFYPLFISTVGCYKLILRIGFLNYFTN